LQLSSYSLSGLDYLAFSVQLIPKVMVSELIYPSGQNLCMHTVHLSHIYDTS